MDFEIKPAGDEALLAEFGNEISDDINLKVYRMRDWIGRQRIKGIKEMLPTFRSLLIYYSPKEIGYKELAHKLKKFKSDGSGERDMKKRALIVPCCYESKYGEDLEGMALETGLSTEEIVKLHTEPFYKIYMMGFLPGFVYLGGLNKKICVPRLQTPRVKIPARSVGIGGSQTGVYPIESPGGWRLIGSTPLDFYDPEQEDPVLCRSGEYIKFEAVDSKDYELIRQEVISGRYRAEYMEG